VMDSSLADLRREFLGRRMITVATAEESPRLQLVGVEELAREPYRLTLAVDTTAVSVERVVAALLDRYGISDLMIENPPLEEVIKAIYRDSARARVREQVPA
jgi:ABC-2 type transport system ATP-binding protein